MYYGICGVKFEVILRGFVTIKMGWKHCQTVDHPKREPQVGSGLFGIRLRGWALLKFFYLQGGRSLLGISNGPIQFESARKIWPLVELLAKIR